MKRKAASRVLYGAFLTVTHVQTTMLRFPFQDWGEDLFTEGEKEFLERHKKRLHREGEAIRILGHRLERS
jgi:hypothetical protein